MISMAIDGRSLDSGIVPLAGAGYMWVLCEKSVFEISISETYIRLANFISP